MPGESHTRPARGPGKTGVLAWVRVKEAAGFCKRDGQNAGLAGFSRRFIGSRWSLRAGYLFVVHGWRIAVGGRVPAGAGLQVVKERGDFDGDGLSLAVACLKTCLNADDRSNVRIQICHQCRPRGKAFAFARLKLGNCLARGRVGSLDVKG